jgi:hypothetical protein
MLRNFIRLIEPITAVQSKYPTYFEGLSLTRHELSLIQAVLPILETFTTINTVLQAEQTPTLSQALIYLNRINSLLSNAKTNLANQEFPELVKGINNALQKLNKYYPIKPNITNIKAYWLHIYAVILDPRFKLKPFQIGNIWGSREQTLIERNFRGLFQQYKQRFRESPEPSNQDQEDSQNTLFSDIYYEIHASGAESEGDEIKQYLAEGYATESTNILVYWRSSRFRILAEMARDIIGINPTSAPIERQFSRASDITNPPKRNRLTKRRINQLCCLKSWLSIKEEIEEDPLEDISDDTDYSEGEDIV